MAKENDFATLEAIIRAQERTLSTYTKGIESMLVRLTKIEEMQRQSAGSADASSARFNKTAKYESNSVIETSIVKQIAKLSKVVESIETINPKPAVYELYYAHRAVIGEGWRYAAAGVRFDDIKEAMNSLTYLMNELDELRGYFRQVGESETGTINYKRDDAATLSVSPHTRKFKIGDNVTKSSGSKWSGKVVGYYSTIHIPLGYCVEVFHEVGNVHFYPESALISAEFD